MNLEKYAKEILAWKNGEDTQWYSEHTDTWIDVPKPSPRQMSYVLPDQDIPWRIKPKDKGD